MKYSVIAPKSSTKEFRGFAIQTAIAIREANARLIANFLEQGKLYKSALGILKRKGNREFLAENDLAATAVRKYIQFFETWGDFETVQIQQVDFLVLLKLCTPKYKEVVQELKNTAKVTQQLVDSLLQGLKKPKEPKPTKPVTGWKQTKRGRYYSVALHDEETGQKIEKIAEVERISRQKVIATAIAKRSPQSGIAHLLEQRAKILNFDPIVELERCKQRGRIVDFADSDGVWLINVDGHELEAVTPQGLAMYLRRLEASAA